MRGMVVYFSKVGDVGIQSSERQGIHSIASLVLEGRRVVKQV